MSATTPPPARRPPLPIPTGPMRGAIVLTGIVANTLFWCVPLLILAAAKRLAPAGRRVGLSHRLTQVAEGWISVNTCLLGITQSIDWDIRGVDGLAPDHWYLVVANHRSWTDILALQVALNRRIPLLKFFIKDQLRWVPVLGFAWWALDMPFMKRYSRAQLERHPELRGTDLATTRVACERFRQLPTSVINFVEGTRFTPAKHADRASPYRYLLPPRAGGIAFVLGAMGSMFTELLDVTIAYPQGDGGFWALCCGHIPAITIAIERQPVPPWLCAGDYAGDPVFRERFQQWLGALWTRKDERLAALLGPDRALVPVAAPDRA